MSGRFRHLVRHTLVYGLGGVLQRFVGFLLIPLYTRYLEPTDYGVLALAGVLQTVVQQVQLLGIPSGMTRSAVLRGGGEGAQAEAETTGGWTVLVQGLLLAAILIPFSGVLSRVVFGEEGYTHLIWIIAAGTPFYAIESLRNTVYRIREQSRAYSTVAFVSFLVNAGLAILLVVGLGWGVEGVLWAQVGASATMTVIFIPWLRRILWRGASVSRERFREMMAYGLPLLPAGLAGWALGLSDRYILRLYVPMDELGLYSLGYRIGSVLLMAAMALRLSWPQVMYTQARVDERAAKRFFSRALSYYCLGMSFLVLSIAALAPDILRLMTPPAFHEAARVVPLIALAHGIQGMMIILQLGIDIRGRTMLIPVFTALAAGVNIGLNLLLIPRFGIMGAAASTFIAFAVVPLGNLLSTRVLYPVAFEWGRILGFVVPAIGVFLLARATQGLEGAAGPALRGGLLLAYPVVLWFLPLFDAGERRIVSGWFRLAQARGGS